MVTLAGSIMLFIVGLAFGSFTNAAVYRIHSGRAKSLINDRSECIHCHHVLAWYDLIPVLSWISLKGKCRYCGKKIEDTPLTEVGVAVAFALSFVFWPHALVTTYDIVQFCVWLLELVLLGILFVYDARWYLLPNRIVYSLVIIAGLDLVFMFVTGHGSSGLLLNALGSVVAISGLYGLLYYFSRGRWIGFGDVKLGIFLGIALHDWRLALLTLFSANLLGCLYIIPGLASKKLSRNSQVPFGPFLILGFFISMLVGVQIVTWYGSLLR